MDPRVEESLKRLHYELNRRHTESRAEVLAQIAERSFVACNNRAVTENREQEDQHVSPTSEVTPRSQRVMTQWSAIAAFVAVLIAALFLVQRDEDVGYRRAVAELAASDSWSYSIEYRQAGGAYEPGPSDSRSLVESRYESELPANQQPLPGLRQVKPNEEADHNLRPRLRSLDSPETPPMPDAVPDWAQKDRWLAALRNSVGRERPLGKSKVQSAVAIGYELEADGFVYRLWLDADTGAPLRLEIASCENDERVILSQFSRSSGRPQERPSSGTGTLKETQQ